MTIIIRSIEKLAEIEPLVQLQIDIWGFSERIAVPAEYMKVVATSGGCVLGAFEGEQVLAFALSVPAFDAHLRPYHHLHMLGTHPQARGKGLAHQLLLEQYALSAQMGIEKIIWTFDPFELTNARLYLHRSSAVIASPYLPNAYGDWGNGLPTDRLKATRYLTMPFREPCLPFASLEDFAKQYTIVNSAGKPTVPQNLPTQASIAIEMPTHFNQIIQQDLALALAWKQSIAHIFTYYLQAGYVAHDLVEVAGKFFYLLDQNSTDFIPKEA